MWECRASRDSSHLALCATLSCCDILVRAPPPCLSPLPPPRLARTIGPCSSRCSHRNSQRSIYAKKSTLRHQNPPLICSCSWWKMELTRPRAGQLGDIQLHGLLLSWGAEASHPCVTTSSRRHWALPSFRRVVCVRQSVTEPGGPVPWKKGGLRQYGKA